MKYRRNTTLHDKQTAVSPGRVAGRRCAVWFVSALAFSTVAAVAAVPQEHQHEEGHQHEQHGDDEAAHGDGEHRFDGPAIHSFENVERFARIFESPERAAWQMPDKVVDALKLQPGMTVADIGSGTGYFTVRLAAAVAPSGTVYGADVEAGMAVYLRDRADEEDVAGIVPVLSSYTDPRLPDGGVDVIFICDTWHHIEDRADYARRLKADLAEGGRVVIVDFKPGDLPVGPPAGHKLAAEQVEEDFTAAGYERVEAPEFLPYQYFLVFAPRP